MTTNPHPRTTTDPAEIDAAIAAHESRLLTTSQAHVLFGDLKAAVRAAAPRSVNDAKTLLATGSRYLSEVADPLGPTDFDGLLTELGVARWSHAWVRRGGNLRTLQNHLGRLNRLLDAQAGRPPRTPPSPRCPSTRSPYSQDWLMTTFDTLIDDDPAAAAALAAGAGAGLVVPQVVGACIEASSPPRVAGFDGQTSLVLTPWHTRARLVAGIRVDRPAWKRLRQLVASDQSLAADRLRVTWAVAYLGQPRPLVELLAERSLSRHQLDAARPHLTPADPRDIEALLHGD